MSLKKYIPTSIKLFISIQLRNCRDLINGNLFRLVKTPNDRKDKKLDLPIQYTISQRIMPNEYFDNKIENLNIAIRKINSLVIPSGKIFSFNKIVGNPSINNGFKESRSIKNGIVVPEVGGGLCQLPWIMYHLCLQTNIKVIERHHHSKDIYDETTRFAPLGSDATIVYGYKDFRMENNMDSDISFLFSIDKDILSCSLCCNSKVTINEVTFSFSALDKNNLIVRTQINGNIIKKDIYQID